MLEEGGQEGAEAKEMLEAWLRLKMAPLWRLVIRNWNALRVEDARQELLLGEEGTEGGGLMGEAMGEEDG